VWDPEHVMKKRHLSIYCTSIFFLVLILIGIFIKNDNDLHKEEDLRPPTDMASYYWDFGYFRINPKTILTSLERGDTNVLVPLSEDEALGLEEIPDLSIYWRQADFLKIASAVGQIVWDDPMDLKGWNVYSIDFSGSCGFPTGFDSASITYFDAGSKRYETRYIEIEPYFGWVRWGNGKTYPKPILRKWRSVDLAGSKINADEVLRLVNENIKAHFQIKDNICGVAMYSSRYDPKNWHLDIRRGSLDPIFYTVDLETGNIIRIAR
jgi:hypothetical protein